MEYLPKSQPSEALQRSVSGTRMTQGEDLTTLSPAVQAFRFTIMAGCVLTMVSSIRSFMVDRSTPPSFFTNQGETQESHDKADAFSPYIASTVS